MKKTLLTVLLISVFSFINAQTEVEKVNSTVFKSDIESHIYFLASDELRGRKTGTPEIDIAASYIAAVLRKNNVKPMGDNGSYYQNVKFETKSAAKQIEVSLNNLKIDSILQLQGENIDFEGKLVFVNYGMDEDYKNMNVEGKFVVAKIGTSTGEQSLRGNFRDSRSKRMTAKKYGAKGLIELGKLDQKDWENLEHYMSRGSTGLQNSDTKPEEIIHLWIADHNQALENQISTKKSTALKVKISGIGYKYFTSRNVVGVLEGTDPKLKDEYIIYSAHYDHNGVGKPNAENDSIYNGARDNAIGTVTVLSAAENISKYPTKRSSLFILFTAEEMGLLGSKWYVEHPVLPLDKMVYCFNSDNGGYNDTSKITVIGLNRTSEANHIVNAGKEFGLTAIDDPAGEQGLFDRSDNVSFAAKGIPAPTYSLGFNAFDEEINKYYHQVTDNPDNLDYDYLVKFFKSYVLSCRLISNNEETPFWTDGDKYFETGKKLYLKE